ncbi:c-type cytochrome [Hydromonas duriensis]|uniref:Cytochrome c551/c552 n=1 Tax=Hydromonas duriensis TaxID=1527608 RepID=A0A4R6YA10_9BURK|nr:c-type cytochrome [Hydromonas duriensis]TDR32351.1 cytochrome c551/c552 [Hydromonas duriensis]
MKNSTALRIAYFLITSIALTACNDNTRQNMNQEQTPQEPQVNSASPTHSTDARPPAPAFAQQKNCFSCHTRDAKMVGPAWTSIAEKYKNDKDAVTKLTAKVLSGGSGSFGPVVMPPQAHLKPEEAQYLVEWILSQAPTTPKK